MRFLPLPFHGCPCKFWIQSSLSNEASLRGYDRGNLRFERRGGGARGGSLFLRSLPSSPSVLPKTPATQISSIISGNPYKVNNHWRAKSVNLWMLWFRFILSFVLGDMVMYDKQRQIKFKSRTKLRTMWTPLWALKIIQCVKHFCNWL